MSLYHLSYIFLPDGPDPGPDPQSQCLNQPLRTERPGPRTYPNSNDWEATHSGERQESQLLYCLRAPAHHTWRQIGNADLEMQFDPIAMSISSDKAEYCNATFSWMLLLYILVFYLCATSWISIPWANYILIASLSWIWHLSVNQSIFGRGQWFSNDLDRRYFLRSFTLLLGSEEALTH